MRVKDDPCWRALRRAEGSLYKAQDAMTAQAKGALAMRAQELRHEILLLTQEYVDSHATEQ